MRMLWTSYAGSAIVASKGMIERPITNRFTRIRQEITLRRFLMVIVLAFNLRNFEYFPGGRPIEEFYFVLCLLAFAFLFPMFKILTSWRFSRFELYLLFTMVVLVILPATSAFRVFGQPLLYGILAKRSVILLGTWILFLNAWRFRYFDEKDIERVLLFLVWLITAIFAFMRIFLDPSSFSNAPVGFILGSGVDLAFAVPGSLLPFGVLYYVLRGIRTHRMLDYLFGLTIFFVDAGSSWRALTLSLTGSILFFLFRRLPLDKAVLWIVRGLAIGALSIGGLQIARPGLVASTVDHLAQALKVATGGGPSNDSSANARILETDVALPYVRSNPILGSGLLSVQWNGGEPGVLGVYFSDTDIGLIGVLFTSGLVGFLVAGAQYAYAIAAARRLSTYAHSALIDGVAGYLLFSFLLSLSTGLFMVEIETTSFFVLLLYQISYEPMQSLARENVDSTFGDPAPALASGLS